jgi:hypothetical protein
MKTRLFSVVPKLASMMVIIHSFLVVMALCMWLLASKNAASFGFMLMIIIMLFDFPVEILFWEIIWPNNDLWPNLGGDYLLGMVMTSSWFLFLGGFYWFCIGVIIEIILRKRRKIKKKGTGYEEGKG